MDDHSFILGGLLFLLCFKDSYVFTQRTAVLLPRRSAFALFFLPGKNQPYGEIATMQARHIATVFHMALTGSYAGNALRGLSSSAVVCRHGLPERYPIVFIARYVYTSRNKTKTGVT